MIKAIVLDIGGVLIRTEDRSSRQTLEKTYGLSEGGIDELVFDSQQAVDSTIGLVDCSEIWQHVADTLSLSSESLRTFKQAFWQGDRLDHEMITFLKSCRPDYTTAFLTNAWVNTRKNLSEEYQVMEGPTVDHILISSELGVAKPDPRIYHILSRILSYRYEEILFVDDFIENVRTAENLGIETIHYRPGLNLIYEIKSRLNKV